MNNNPIKYIDPSGHYATYDDSSTCVGDDCVSAEFIGYLYNNSTIRSGQGNDSTDALQKRFEASTNLSSAIADSSSPPCDTLFSQSSCQNISGGISALVFAGDITSLSLSTVGSIFALLAIPGGPLTEGGVIAGYQVLNYIEGVIGAVDMGLVVINDAIFTGETYISSDPQPELILGHDTTIAMAMAVAGGADPDPFGDTFFNSIALANDLYKFTGGESLIETHINLINVTWSYFETPWSNH